MAGELSKIAARRLAKKLAGEGMEHGDIGLKLAAAGYVSKRGGQPLKASGVYYLITTPSYRRGAKEAVEALKKILRLDMSADDRVALMQLILGD